MGERSEREIRESIDATRARMGETIEQIGDRVNPDRVKSDLKAKAREQIDDAKDNVKRKARNTMRDIEHGVTDTGRGIWATIRDNPVPAGMVGVGLAWLIANRRDSDEHRLGTYSTGPAVPYRPGYGSGRYSEASVRSGQMGAMGTTGYGDAGYGASGSRGGAEGRSGGTGSLDHGYSSRPDARTTGFAASGSLRDDGTDSEGLRDKASDALHEAGDRLGNVQDKVSNAVDDVQERAGEMVAGTRDRVSDWAHGAKDRAVRAEHRVEDSMRDNPMAAGAVALAIGMAAGLIIPETQREHQAMGRTRDRLIDKAQDKFRTSAEKLHDSAREKAGEAARHAVDEVWPGGDEPTHGRDSGVAGGFSEPRR
jgi:ElaB/YqjD/DUF883 family membrane-anchored ribosome-binding protein